MNNRPVHEHEKTAVGQGSQIGIERVGAAKSYGAFTLMLTFWFDVHSPWCYLASTRIEGIAAKYSCELKWRPLHLPRLIEAIDGRRPRRQSVARVQRRAGAVHEWDADVLFGAPGGASWHHSVHPRRSSGTRVAGLRTKWAHSCRSPIERDADPNTSTEESR